MQTGVGMRKGKKFAYGTCGIRAGMKFSNVTAGTVWLMCPCGFMFPAMEMPDSENTRFIMMYLLRIFRNRPYVQPGRDSMVVLFDDMCHLLR